MEDNQLTVFMESGIFQLNSNAFFIDPVRILNRSYTRFRVSPSTYYSRFFDSSNSTESIKASEDSRKRKRKQKKKPQSLNEREQIADQRHQEVKPLLLKAHEALLEATDLLKDLRNLRNDGCAAGGCKELSQESSELSFLELGSVWQAPLYEIVLNCHQDDKTSQDGGSTLVRSIEQRVTPAFNNLIANEESCDIEAELFNHKYIIPKRSCFYMSDLRQIDNLIPADSDCGFNLIVLDPPWENGSAHQKLRYPTLPNRYFLSLPVKQLCHTSGALVALWVTNREKLRGFVQNQLFPKWGVKYAASFYWLKVKANGMMTGELDLFHHRPYECLLLGYCNGKDTHSGNLTKLNPIPDNRVFISVPSDYSRKPPIGELLLDYLPGSRPARCIELFAREMITGWTSWGNEPLHFQDLRYFVSKTTEK
ncbi:methyltransferase-like protein 2 [Lycium ferocissimum]|uniref:methyltransferase-like protein 2 n=1 Tax=Lycium ferocissimum TaxID=112874 RepID=UPI0028163FBF|nr:methyltransferase-like protein 2 [Lycium ferocissimum]XP_059279185.1 methyltransferase-like protein 2 [Lycium ferocissimum]XP_059279186.1 methyltransferase-like protein 2 [Lycium ferocissimum]XP_059279187.1 methyltransferase-like protein 2 [Lycium ferocissimum]